MRDTCNHFLFRVTVIKTLTGTRTASPAACVGSAWLGVTGGGGGRGWCVETASRSAGAVTTSSWPGMRSEDEDICVK